MAVIIDGDLGVDKIKDGTIVAADIGTGEVGATQLASTLDLSSKTITLPNATKEVKAWVNYNQLSPSIVSSYNVSSVTDNSTGNFTVNFTTAMSGTTYLALAGSGYSNTGRGGYFVGEDFEDRAKTTSSCKFKVRAASTSSSDAQLVDREIMNIIIME